MGRETGRSRRYCSKRQAVVERNLAYVVLTAEFQTTIPKMTKRRPARTRMRIYRPLTMAMPESIMWKWGKTANRSLGKGAD